MSKLTLLQKINVIMQEVKYVQKTDQKVNKQYTFVTHDSVAKIFHAKLAEHGIVALPSVRETKQDGNRTEMLVDIKFINVDDANDHFTVTHLGYGVDPSDKGPGKAMSYAVKYAFLKVFCLETGDDPESDANSVHEAANEKSAPSKVTSIESGKITEAQAKNLLALVKKCPIDYQNSFKAHILSKYKTSKLDELPVGSYADCLDRVTIFLKEAVNA